MRGMGKQYTICAMHLRKIDVTDPNDDIEVERESVNGYNNNHIINL